MRARPPGDSEVISTSGVIILNPCFCSCMSRTTSGCSAPARMGRGSAHIKVLDGRAELRPARYWSQEEELLERKLALEDIAFAQAKIAFQIKRRDHLPVQDDVLDIGRVLGNGIDHVVAEGLFLVIPVQAGTQLVR